MPDGLMASPAVGRVTATYMSYPGHAGIDIANNVGTPIHAAYGGTVLRAGGTGTVPGRTGNGIVIRSANGQGQYYGHLSAIQVSVEQSVNIGQQIGLMGATGNVTGPHLHFECWDNANDSNSIHNPQIDFDTHGLTPGQAYTPNQEDDMTPEQAAQLKKIHDIVRTLDVTESKIDQLWQRRAVIDLINGIKNKVDTL